MTDWEHIEAVVEELQAANEDLNTLLDKPGSEFSERFRRWKERTSAYIRRTVGDEEADRFDQVSTHWDNLYPRSFIGMLERHGGFLNVLAEEIERNPGKMLSGKEPPGERYRLDPPSRVFISHAASDRLIAEEIRRLLIQHQQELKVFIASRPGHITTGEEWWDRVASELRAADSYIIVLTPQSIDRPWIAFETGAAWYSSRRLLTVSCAGLDRSGVQLPLSTFQINSLEVPEELEATFKELGIALDNPKDIAERFREIGYGENSANWEGVELNGRYFAWEGPGLWGFQDRDPEPTPPDLTDEIRQSGWIPSYTVPANLEKTLARGRKVVYETDRRSWRRKIWGVEGEQILVVREKE